jgi:SSS family solute:Na+ symporter
VIAKLHQDTAIGGLHRVWLVVLRAIVAGPHRNRSRVSPGEAIQRWIRSGAQAAAAKPKPGGKGNIIELAVAFNPCLEVEPGRFYSIDLGDRRTGLNIALGDLDEKEKGRGNFANFYHEDWFTGAKDVRTQLRHWGTLWIRTARKLP